MYSSNIFYQALLNSSNDAVGIFKLLNDTILVENYNENFIKMSILKVSTPKGKRIEEIFDDYIAIRFKEKIYECLSLKKSLNYTANYIINGEVSYRSICLNPLFIEDKIIIFVFCKDITETILEQRKKDELLLEYECLFSLSDNPTCLLLIDENNTVKIERQNKAFENFKKIYIKHHPNYNPKELLSKVLEEKEQINGDLCIDLQNGHYLYYTFTIIPIVKENKVIKAFINCMNTTEKVKMTKKINANITKREKEVLEWVVEGNTNKYIAFKLQITEGTVKKLLFNSYKKLGISSRSELLKFYLSEKPTYSDN